MPWDCAQGGSGQTEMGLPGGWTLQSWFDMESSNPEWPKVWSATCLGKNGEGPPGKSAVALFKGELFCMKGQ